MNRIVDLEELTVASLFALRADDPTELAVGIDQDSLGDIAKKAESLSKPVPWSEVQTSIAGALTGALQSTVLSGWVSAWQKWKELDTKAEMSLEDPKTPFSCTLLEHVIDSSLHPYVEVFLGSKLVQKIDFDVALETEIDGVILSLLEGSIVALQPGRCQWSGKISLEDVEVINRELTTLDLPGRIALKHPIPIAVRKEPVSKSR